ncbi:asparagine synthase C-terminal domain-containing protein [Myxococcota bacterium]|nr:asparagine synthase C-terminal domain-containing protein [Myxococcota bacterium]MBU1537719.1 asparagine synthase C-terminal domain-containing protein [Myxococcota bacterium]
MPIEYLYGQGKTKRILRDIIQAHLPPEVLTHKKQGFSVPLREWFRGELREQLKEAVNSPVYRASGLFDPAYVHKLHRLHTTEALDLSWQMWQLLIFARWHEQPNPT